MADNIEFDFATTSLEQQNKVKKLAVELDLIDKQWEIYDEEVEQCKIVLKHAKLVRAESILLGINQTEVLAKPCDILMPHIRFEQLEDLQLSDCRIVSIEFLVNLTAPSLTSLDLSKNLITNCKAFKKCNFPNLQHIQLEHNKFSELDSLSQLNGHSQYLNLQLEEFDNELICQNINFLAKMQLTPLKICKICFNYIAKARVELIMKLFGAQQAK